MTCGCGARTELALEDDSAEDPCNAAFPHSDGSFPDVAIALAPDGLVLAGSFEGTLTFEGIELSSAGGDALFVTKLDRRCRVVWAKSFPSDDYATIVDVRVGPSGGIVVAGEVLGEVDLGGGPLHSSPGVFSDRFVAGLDERGGHLWSRVFRGAAVAKLPYGPGVDVAVDTTGAAVVTGYFDDETDLGGGPLVGEPLRMDAFLAKLSPQGEHLWSKAFAAPDGNAWGERVAVDGASDILWLGDFEGTLDLGGGPMAATSRRGFAAKFTTGGDPLWNIALPDPPDVDTALVPEALALGAAGDVFALSLWGDQITRGKQLSKLDPTGKLLWTNEIAGSDRDDHARGSLSADEEDGAALVASCRLVCDYGGGWLSADDSAVNDRDVLAARYDADGGHRWSRLFGADGWDLGRAIAVDSGGRVFLAGVFTGDIDFGHVQLKGSGGNGPYDPNADVFLVRLP